MTTLHPSISPALRLMSAYNRVWFELQKSIKWSRSVYYEQAAGHLFGLGADQKIRIRALQERYQVAFEVQFQRSLALSNYYYLDILDSSGFLLSIPSENLSLSTSC